MKLAVMLCVVLVSARVASAQAATPAEPALVASDGDRSPGTAVMMSLGGSAVSWALLIASTQMHDSSSARAMAITGGLGTLVAPSFGHWYAHSYMTWGQGIRLGSLAVASIGFATVASTLWTEGNDGQELAGIVLLGAGGLAYVSASIYDIATAGAAVERYNTRRHKLSLVPVVNPVAGSYGVAFGGQF